jgi:ankyrin repeat protein
MYMRRIRMESHRYIGLLDGRSLGIVKGLVESGANVHAQDKLGATPLHMAAHIGNVKIVKLLVELGANVHAQAKSGATSLHLATSKGHEEIVKLLVELGGNVACKC